MQRLRVPGAWGEEADKEARVRSPQRLPAQGVSRGGWGGQALAWADPEPQGHPDLLSHFPAPRGTREGLLL